MDGMELDHMEKVFFCAALLAASVATTHAAEVASQGAKLYGDVTRGREVVNRWCVSCHALGAPIDDRIPSLLALARNMARSEGAVRAFLMHPHEPMPPLEISNQQIEDIVAYLRTVRPESSP